MKISVSLPFEEGPQWLEELQFTRDGNKIIIQVVKETGLQYAVTKVSLVDFNDLAETLLKPGS